MDRAPLILTLFCAIFSVMLNFAAAQNVYTVGDEIGWDIPRAASVSYVNWASGKTFSVGDILVFNFVTNQHDLVQVTRASYDACDDDNEIGSIITTGPANVTLITTGDHYYICTFGPHCEAGQKLAITVGSSTPDIANPPTTAPPTTPATPSPASSLPDPCAPVPSQSLAPNAGNGPTAATARPSPPPDSASTSLASGFLLVLLSISVALIV
ncbi:cucumber peeling cupredoxin-like isoform X2 [Primulina tabacum]|uniref:cucumber peeling cupredoxin-like isoform X2 n=1 Tax=Primulina tabacum TaxID=48773 RepID=UPI003F5AB46F